MKLALEDQRNKSQSNQLMDIGKIHLMENHDHDFLLAILIPKYNLAIRNH